MHIVACFQHCKLYIHAREVPHLAVHRGDRLAVCLVYIDVIILCVRQLRSSALLATSERLATTKWYRAHALLSLAFLDLTYSRMHRNSRGSIRRGG
jgi:hypothetical protein